MYFFGKKIYGAVPDSGLFNLQVNGVTVDSLSEPTDTTYISGDGSDVGNGAAVRLRIDDDGLAGEPADFGNFRVGEVEGSGTTLQDNYQTSILCDDDAGTEAVFTSGAAGTREVTGINLKAGNVVTCTITNKVVPAAAACPVQ